MHWKFNMKIIKKFIQKFIKKFIIPYYRTAKTQSISCCTAPQSAQQAEGAGLETQGCAALRRTTVRRLPQHFVASRIAALWENENTVRDRCKRLRMEATRWRKTRVKEKGKNEERAQMKNLSKIQASREEEENRGGGGPPELESTWLRLNYRLISNKTVRVKHPDVAFVLARQAAYIRT